MNATARSLVPLAAGTVAVRRDHAGIRTDGLGGRWVSPYLGVGGTHDIERTTTYAPPIALPPYIIDALLRFNGLARNVMRREPYDCTREGFELEGDDAKVLAESATRSIAGREDLPDDTTDDGVLRLLFRARCWARAYGGSAIWVMVDDGLPTEAPLDLTRIRRVLGARVMTRWEVTPSEWNRERGSPRAGMPTIYTVTIGGVSVMRVHRSRLVLLQGEDLPDHLLQQQQGWGGSLFDPLWPALRNLQMSLQMIPRQISRQAQGVFTMANLREAVAGGYKDEVVERLAAQVEAMSATGDIALQDGDKYDILQRPMSGTGELLEALRLDVVANGDGMPKILIYSETPGGLRAGAKNPEYKAWLDDCGGRQKRIYEPPLLRLLTIVASASEGPTGGIVPDLIVKWRKLYTLDEEEAANVENTRAQARASDVNSAIVTPAEVRDDPRMRELYPGMAADVVPATPGVEPTTPAPDVSAPAADTVADQALNGAQVASLLEIVKAVNVGELTYEQGIGSLAVAFPTLRGREATVLGAKRDPVAPAQPQVGAAVTDELEAAPPSEHRPPPDPASPREAAAAWGVPTVTITRLIKSGTLPHWRIGSRTIVSLSAVGQLASRPATPAEAVDEKTIDS